MVTDFTAATSCEPPSTRPYDTAIEVRMERFKNLDSAMLAHFKTCLMCTTLYWYQYDLLPAGVSWVDTDFYNWAAEFPVFSEEYSIKANPEIYGSDPFCGPFPRSGENVVEAMMQIVMTEPYPGAIAHLNECENCRRLCYVVNKNQLPAGVTLTREDQHYFSPEEARRKRDNFWKMVDERGGRKSRSSKDIALSKVDDVLKKEE